MSQSIDRYEGAIKNYNDKIPLLNSDTEIFKGTIKALLIIGLLGVFLVALGFAHHNPYLIGTGFGLIAVTGILLAVSIIGTFVIESVKRNLESHKGVDVLWKVILEASKDENLEEADSNKILKHISELKQNDFVFLLEKLDQTTQLIENEKNYILGLIASNPLKLVRSLLMISPDLNTKILEKMNDEQRHTFYLEFNRSFHNIIKKYRENPLPTDAKMDPKASHQLDVYRSLLQEFAETYSDSQNTNSSYFQSQLFKFIDKSFPSFIAVCSFFHSHPPLLAHKLSEENLLDSHEYSLEEKESYLDKKKTLFWNLTNEFKTIWESIHPTDQEILIIRNKARTQNPYYNYPGNGLQIQSRKKQQEMRFFYLYERFPQKKNN